MSRADAARIPGARSLRPRLQVVNAWRWDGTRADAALMGQWLIALGVDRDDVRAHYREERRGITGVTSAHVEIGVGVDRTQIMGAGEWLLWFGGTAFMIVDDNTRALMFATDEDAPLLVIQPDD